MNATPATIKQVFQLKDLPSIVPRYNIAPSQDVAIIRQVGEDRELVHARWGLVPSWSKDPKTPYSTINARAETVASKPAFRSAFRLRRCLVPASGYFEWQVQAGGKTKQPYYIHTNDRSILAFAGLWETWGHGDEAFDSCTIIVTDASEYTRGIHERMSVILDPDDFDGWLQHGGEEFLRPLRTDRLSMYRVSALVNSPRNTDAAIIEPLETSDQETPAGKG